MALDAPTPGMPSLADVHGGSRSGGSTSDGTWGGESPATAGDAAQVSLYLTAVGVPMFLLGIGFAFFFDSILGTVGYFTALGLGVYGLVRLLVATVPTRDLPGLLARGSGRTGRGRRTAAGRLRDRLSGSGRALGGSRSRSRGLGRSRGRTAAPLARLRRAVSSLRSSRGGGDRL